MKIHRIELRDFRGVLHSEVDFADVGVTIIEGDNEVGKTSLAEAVDLIFEYADSSSARRVKAVQPVDRDVGPQVTVEVSTGPYRFVYSKRWCRQKETVLKLLAPAPGQLTGKEAHDRVTAILDETLDLELWKAFQLTQGTELTQPGLNVTSLARALDATAEGNAADGRSAADVDSDLWQRITDEYHRYFTPSGQDHKERKELAAKLLASHEGLADVEGKLAGLQVDVERVAALTTEIDALGERRVAQELEIGELIERHDKVRHLGDAVDQAVTAQELALLGQKAAAEAMERRAALVAGVEAGTEQLAQRRDELTNAAPGRSQAIARQAAAQVVLVDRRQVHAAAEAAHTLAAADERWRRDEFDLTDLVKRRQRIDDEQRRLLTAEATLSGIPVDEGTVEAIEAANMAVATVAAEARSGATTVEAIALRDITVEIDGAPLSLGVDEHHLVTVEGITELVLADTVRVVVSAGQDASDLAGRLVAARRELAELCSAVGVDDLADARTAASVWANAQRNRDDARAIIARELNDLTLEVMDAKIGRLRDAVTSYVAKRSAPEASPENLDEAKASARATQAPLERAQTVMADAEREVEQADRAVSDLDVATAALTAGVDIAKGALEHAQMLLTAARGERSDEDLAKVRLDAETALSKASVAASEAKAALEAHDPTTLTTLLENTEAALARCNSELADRQDELRDRRARLALLGEAGLGETRDVVVTEIAHLTDARERLEARAVAAQLLYTTYESRREESRQRYVEPFRAGIQSLGRIVYGHGFDVTLDADLQIDQRTLDGVTVAFDQLSTGAKEQLGIIARLACATIVSADGGAPVIFDDALGWTDPARLKTMGAAIAHAGRDCQIIVLTCTPGRYASVGTATVVRLEG